MLKACPFKSLEVFSLFIFELIPPFFLTFEYSIVLLSALICSANQIHELFADSITKFLPLFYEIR